MTDKAAPSERLQFGYSKSLFYQRTLFGFVALLSTVLVLGLMLQTAILWLLLVSSMFVAYVAIFGLSPMTTSHGLRGTSLILKQGWYFNAVIPIDRIESMERWEGKIKLGVGFSILDDVLYVTSSKLGLVSIKLRDPMRFTHALGKRARRIVVSVENPVKFVEAVQKRISSLSPV